MQGTGLGFRMEERDQYIVAIGILIYLKHKNVRLFDTALTTDNSRTLWKKIADQKDKIIAALFETGGQATYLFALSEGTGVAAVILGAGTVIISFILSRIMLKEKLTKLQYYFISMIFIGIIIISLAG